MREGCLGLLISLASRVVSVVLVCVGVVLFLLGVFAFQPSFSFMTVAVAALALGGAYLLVRVGRDVWSDLADSLTARKKPDPPDDESDRDTEA